MTKAIKFNLMLDGKPVRDLESLKENFNLDDILAHYNSGVLQRWLEVRGYDEHFKKISDVRDENELGIAESLVRAFGVAKNLEDIKRASFKFQSKREREQFLDKIEASKIKRNEVIASYHGGYNKLINEMIEKSDDITFAKQALNDIHQNYNQLWLVDFDRAFIDFCSKAPFVIFAILMNDSYRELIMSDDSKIQKIVPLIPIPKVSTNNGGTFFTATNAIITATYAMPGNNASPEETLQPPFKYYAGNTDEYWKDIETKDKKYLIIVLEDGDFVRSSGNRDQEFKKTDVYLKFPMLEGVDYKSNNSKHMLIYLEV